MEYKLQRSKRKTLAIQISSKAKIIVKAPNRLPKKDIDSFIDLKKGWITEIIAKAEKNYKAAEGFQIKEGSMLFYLGEEYPVRIIYDGYSYFDRNFFYIKDGTQEERREEVINIYRSLALDYIIPIIAFYAKEMDVEPLSVKVHNSKTYWGACSPTNCLNFSWRLVWTNYKSIEYVVVHELAHIKQHNHSPEFWKIVESIIPDWKTRKAQLKFYAERVRIEYWN